MGRSSPTRGPGSASPSNRRAGRKRGYAYIAITDHSNRVTTARGLDARRLRQQWRAIDKVDLIESIGLKPMGEVVDGQFRFPLVVRLPDEWRNSPEAVSSLAAWTK